MILIDGTHGGGQLLRSSLSLSAVTGKSFKMINIRGRREKSGLQAQHLTVVNAIKEVCGADVKGNELYSHELEFIPKKVLGGEYKWDIGTAGSTTLIFQTLLPVLLFTERESVVEIIGGTANPFAPPALEIKEVFLKYLEKFGIELEFEILKEGFYPKGGGKIKFRVQPVKKLKVCFFGERGEYRSANIFAVASEELKKAEVAKRLIKGFKVNFQVLENLKEVEEYVKSLSEGCYIHANVEYESAKLAYTLLGERGKKSEDLGKECAEKLLKIKESDAVVDHFTGDQLLIYLALAGWGSLCTDDITEHCRTNSGVIEKFLPVQFKVNKKNIECVSRE